MTRKGSGLSNQRAWEIWKILGKRSKGEYPLGLFKPPKKEKIDPDISDEEREENRLRGVSRKPRKADKTALLASIKEDRAHADAALQVETERAEKLKAEMADYEADPAPMTDRLHVFMGCMAYHSFALEERIDAEVDQREFRSGIPGVSDHEFRCLIRSHWQAVTKQCCEQHGADFKEIVEWMRERIRGITEGDVKRTADEAIRRGYAQETRSDVLYDYQRRYDITATGLSFVHDHGLMSKDARFEGLNAAPPEATSDGAVDQLAQRVEELLRRHDVLKESCGLEETLGTVSRVMSEIREMVPDLVTASAEHMDKVITRLDCRLEELGEGLTQTGPGSEDWTTELSQAIAEKLKRNGLEGTSDASASDATEATPRDCFRRVGEMWEIRFEGEGGYFADYKGLRYIARLLEHPCPTRPITAVELSEGSTEAEQATHTFQEASDRGARKSYVRELCRLHAEIAELDVEIERAEAENNSTASEATRREKEELLAQVRGIDEHMKRDENPVTEQSRLGGLSCLEKARKAVSAALSRAYRLLEAGDPPMSNLTHHLRLFIMPANGAFAYRPETPRDWMLH